MYKNKGFTFIETVVVLTIMGIMLAMVIPRLSSLQAQSRVASITSDLVSALKQGRSEALVRRVNLQFAAVDGSVTTNVWGNQGWRVIDAASGKVYLEQKGIPFKISIKSTPVLTSFMFVAATGIVTQLDGTPIDVVFTICDKDAKQGKSVTMSRLGRIIISSTSTSVVC